MKRMIVVLTLFFIVGCNSNTIDYDEIATYQDPTIPELAIEVADTTRVLVVVPHADDETIAAGLILYLKEKGATIHLLTLCQHNENRLQELACSADKLGIAKVDIAGFVNNTWDDIMKNELLFWNDNKDSIKSVIGRKMADFKPHILITYDTEIGGYGHPEHYISARLTEELFLENAGISNSAAGYLFQISLSQKLEEFLVKDTPNYENTKRINGSQGLPQPNVSLDISDYWALKNEAARCHQSQLKTLQKFYILYEEGNKNRHIQAFSKEYYRLIQV